MELSSAKVKYLLIIAKLAEETGSARSVDIAVQLGVARPSVCRMLNTLSGLGLVEKKPRGAVRLTEQGERLSACYLSQYKLLLPYFQKIASLSAFDAEECVLAVLGGISRHCADCLCEGIGCVTRSGLPAI